MCRRPLQPPDIVGDIDEDDIAVFFPPLPSIDSPPESNLLSESNSPSESSSPSEPNLPVNSNSLPGFNSPPPAPQPYHANCMHPYTSRAQWTPGSRFPFLLSTSQSQQDIRVHVPLPCPEEGIDIVIHPRWCPECTVHRMRFLDDWKDHVVIEKGQKLYPGMEEEAFRVGVKSGRRAAICLNPEVEDRTEALKVLLHFNANYPAPDPYSLCAVFRTLLAPYPFYTVLIDHWDKLDAQGYALQRQHFDLATITQTCQRANLSRENAHVIGNAVFKYQEGQIEGMYWQWQLEAKAWAYDGQGGRVVNEAMYTDALLLGMPHPVVT